MGQRHETEKLLSGRRMGIRKVEIWVGYCIGFVVTPLVMLLLARTVTAVYDGLDSSGEYGVAVAATRDIAVALDRYRSHHQRVPGLGEGLATLEPEYIDALSVDPWGNPFVYEPSGHGWADVLSYGADGRPGGSGPAADISARFGRLGPRPPGFLHPFAAIVLCGIPLAALLGGRRRRWAAGLLAGVGAFWSVLLLTTLSPTPQFSLVFLLALVAALSCMAGSIAILRQVREARTLTFTWIVAAYLLFEFMMTV